MKSIPEANPTPKAPPRSAKRSAEDETFESLSRLFVEQQALTNQLSSVDQELQVMDARFEAFQAKWERERAALKKKRDEIEGERSNVRNMFKKQRLLDAEDD
jgi:flagellar motility protein MotE (MotC chaperone)